MTGGLSTRHDARWGFVGFGRSAIATILLGLLSLLCFGLSAPRGHAAEARRPVAHHRVVHRIVTRKRIVAHVVRRAIVRHVVWHKPVWHPPVRHPRVVLHPVAWHRPLLRKPVWHKPVWHRPAIRRVVSYGPRMSCVPFARAATGLDISGDAYAWWHNAAGHYARGDAPVPGGVLAFRANARMRLGHVAVVAKVINRREVLVDQANWGDWGRITRDVPVIDVSEDNSWSDVRVSIGDGRFGSVYPTYGFIYNRPDTGRLLVTPRPAPLLAANPAPSDLRALHPFGGSRQEAMAPERLPAPPQWPAHLGHQLVVRPVFHRVVYRRPVAHPMRRFVRRPVARAAVSR